MNKLLEKRNVPGSKTYQLVVPRKDVKKDEAHYQIEFGFGSDVDRD
ncbi:MAG: hypothetical protein O2U61_06755 [Candidatus Bathyarchaeota archaeon]|nr:hypothetical protein [Candidatus Bathyarchaeota archaeon]